MFRIPINPVTRLGIGASCMAQNRLYFRGIPTKFGRQIGRNLQLGLPCSRT